MTISSASIAEVVERFVRTEFQISDRDQAFTRGAHLFDGGFVDSIGLVQLVTFVESTFKVQIGDEALMSEEFTTIDGISELVAAAMAQSLTSQAT